MMICVATIPIARAAENRRQVKHSILRKRSAVVHPNVDRFAIAWVADDKAGAKRQSFVSGS